MARCQYRETPAAPAEAAEPWVFGPVAFSLIAQPLKEFGQTIPAITEPDLSPREVETPEAEKIVSINHAENLPRLILDRLVSGPVGPPAACHAITLPIGLLTLKRGAVDESMHQSDRLPALKSVPIQALAVSSEPIFSFKPVPLVRMLGTNQAALC